MRYYTHENQVAIYRVASGSGYWYWNRIGQEWVDGQADFEPGSEWRRAVPLELALLRPEVEL